MAPSLINSLPLHPSIRLQTNNASSPPHPSIHQLQIGFFWIPLPSIQASKHSPLPNRTLHSPPSHPFRLQSKSNSIYNICHGHTQPRYAAFSHVLLFYGCLIMPYTWFLLSSPSFSCIKSPNGFCLMPLFHFVTLFISILFSMFFYLTQPICLIQYTHFKSFPSTFMF